MATLHTSWGIRERFEAVLKEQIERAVVIVRNARADINLLAHALIERGRLSADEVRKLLSRQPRLRLLEDG